MRISSALRGFALLSSLSLPVDAWGGLGHKTVAFIASSFAKAETQAFFQRILNDSSTEYAANVATWADSYRYTSAGRFSEPFHFIDSLDNPPESCGVTYKRDCGVKGCVIGAIQNYTTRLMDPFLTWSERVQAAKFIVHFVGDIHQPLHDENLDRGGNSIAVTFDGKTTNLHSIWDTAMPEKHVGGYALTDAQTWAANLTAAITRGVYASEAPSWLEGVDISDSVSTSMIWATEANKYVCSTVLPDGAASLTGKELDGDYYKSAVPIIDLQIARAGYRLAAWMDLIATGQETVMEEL
ncbi:MAG: hypothetical protein M1818_006137 [Claussenomyces sp. TS43310]|nr:MAG: hypothetical protein M1818_006137 [Claussenomyces sp. TS43310]